MTTLFFTNSMILFSILFAGFGAYWLCAKKNGAATVSVLVGAYCLAMLYV